MDSQVDNKYLSKFEEKSRRNFTSDVSMQRTWYKQLRPGAHISYPKGHERSKSTNRNPMDIQENRRGATPTLDRNIILPSAGRSHNFTAQTQERMIPGQSRVTARCNSI